MNAVIDAAAAHSIINVTSLTRVTVLNCW